MMPANNPQQQRRQQSAWYNNMPKKLQKHFEHFLPKIKTSARQFVLTLPLKPKQHLRVSVSKWMMFCGTSRRLSSSWSSSRPVSDDQQKQRNQVRDDDGDDDDQEIKNNDAAAATLSDVDRFLLENFRSLFSNDEDLTSSNIEDLRTEIDNQVSEMSSFEISFESTRGPDDPLDDIRLTHRFFASPRKSSSLIEDARSSGGSFYSEFGGSSSCSATTETEMMAKGLQLPEEGIAVFTFSSNPYEDFRRSMVEMIEARLQEIDDHKQLDWDFMEELLFCYLNMNEKKSIKYILCAFADLVVNLRRGKSVGVPARSWKIPAIDRQKTMRRKVDLTYDFDY